MTFLVTERLHTANLPVDADPPELSINGTPVSLVDHKIVTNSPHHRATFYRFVRDDTFGSGHQMMTLRLASGQEATWHLPLVVPEADEADGPIGLGEQWGLILALLGGMLAAMWPCLFQLTVYFIPALAGIAMQDTGASKSTRHVQVMQAAFFFILGFTILYTATGALIGFAAERLGDTAQFEVWQRYFGIVAGVVVMGLAVRVAAKARAPLVCRMPVLARMAHSNKPASRVEMMVAGVAFATGCMTCFGSALVVGMVVYIGLAQSAFYGALVPVSLLAGDGGSVGDRGRGDGESSAALAEARDRGAMDGTLQRAPHGWVRDSADQRQLHGRRGVVLARCKRIGGRAERWKCGCMGRGSGRRAWYRMAAVANANPSAGTANPSMIDDSIIDVSIDASMIRSSFIDHRCIVSLSRANRLHLDRLGFRVQRARDSHLLSCKLVRRLLVGEGVYRLAVIKDEAGAVRTDARPGALGVSRPHAHLGMIARGALAVGDDAGKGLRALARGQRCNDEETYKQRFHG